MTRELSYPRNGQISEDYFQLPLNSGTQFVTNTDKDNPWKESEPVLKIFERLLASGRVKQEQDGSFTFVKERLRELLNNPLS